MSRMFMGVRGAMLKALIALPLLAGTTNASTYLPMTAWPASATCDSAAHRMEVVAFANGVNPDSTSVQTIWVRLWIHNNTANTYPVKYFSDGSTSWMSFQYTPVTVTTDYVSGQVYTTVNNNGSGSYTFTLPTGYYSVWSQYAWYTRSGWVYSKVLQSTQFRSDAFSPYTNSPFITTTYCRV
jgi:hypothetical protein